ncbi:alpha/beta family hydrolase [Litchfieldella qijiaojingensis]|uniref:alpha/beta family hydrolase n=1 Tax=Litchfieldella qijiaojingensis TaxID=980347 RepID=UPI001E4D27F3|nr:alpha/beta family hydrolase [Halomonas qijiaojingensis]
MEDNVQDYARLMPEEAPEYLGQGGQGRLWVVGRGPLEVRGEARHGRLLIAHGAGAGQDSTFMQRLRSALEVQGVQTLAFEFVYMQRMREEGRRRPPPKIDRLVDELAGWCDIVSHPNLSPPWLGGKSMGGRAASLLAARDSAAGLVLCGYPFHPPGKPEKTRLAHWPLLACPVLVMQGARDPFGGRDEVAGYDLTSRTRVHFLEDGEHDWKPRKVSGRTQTSLIEEAAKVIGEYMAMYH